MNATRLEFERGAANLWRAVLVTGAFVAIGWTARASQAAQNPPESKPPEAKPAESDGLSPIPPLLQAPPEDDTVKSIVVHGAKRYSEARLVEALGQKIGAPFDRDVIDRGIKSLWQSFHVRASVSRSAVEGGLELVLDVVELPSDLEPRIVGNDGVDEKTIRDWAGLTDSTELFLYQAARVRQRIIEGYRREGFYFADVDIVTRGGDEKEPNVPPDVIFEIHEGRKVRVHSIHIVGNDSMPDRGFWFWKDGISALSKRDLDPPWTFNWFGSPFVEDTLEADLLAMRNVYRDRGWLDAVVELERKDFNDEHSKVDITIRVDEGPRYRVSSLAVRAFEWAKPDKLDDATLNPAELVFPESELLELCHAQPGVVWETTKRQHDRIKLRDRYGSTGRIADESLSRAVKWDFLEPDLVFDREKHTVAVTYRVVQGRPIRIHEIRFAGAGHTRDKVLRMQLSVYPGQIADLDEIQRSLVRIQGTGYFSDSFHPEDHHEPIYRFRPVEGDLDQWDLEYVVEEGRVVDFSITGGVDSNNGLFGLVSLTMRNFDLGDSPSKPWRAFSEVYEKEAFHGGGQFLGLEVSPGTLVQRYGVHYGDPDIFNRYENPIGLNLDLEKRTRIYDTHDEKRLDIDAKLIKKFTHDFSFGVGLKYTTVDVSNLNTNGVPQALRFEDGEGKLAFQGLLIETGWRKYDNLLNPRKGFWLRGDSTLNGGVFGGDGDFVQTSVSFDHYLPFGDPAETVVSAIHTSIDLGLEDDYGSHSGSVPFTERFFLGGTNTLRGFDFRGVGPIDKKSGFAVGGETSLAGTIEYQYPLYTITQPGTYRQIETLRGGVFVDWGVLDPDPYSLDPTQVRASVGFSVGLAYPLPIALNFGFPIRYEKGDIRRVFSFSIGLR